MEQGGIVGEAELSELAQHESVAAITQTARPLRLLAWLLGGGLLLCALLWCLANFRLPVRDGQPFVSVSPETTWFTEPLDENGDVDYRQLFLDRLPKPLPPEENALVDYLKALGSPRYYFSDVSILKLGLKPSELRYGSVQPHEWATLEFTSESRWTARMQIFSATETEWDPKVVPIVEYYYQEHQDRLQQILKAAEKTDFYYPEDPIWRYRGYFSTVDLVHDASQFLYLDAMRLLGAGDIDSALDRLESTFKIINQVDICPTFFSYYDRTRNTHSTHERLWAVIRTGKCDDSQLQRIEQMIVEYQVPENWTDRIERSMLRDLFSIQFIARAGFSEFDDTEEIQTRVFGLETVNWEHVMRSCVSHYRKIEATINGGVKLERAASAIDHGYFKYLRLRDFKTTEQINEISYYNYPYIFVGTWKLQHVTQHLTHIACNLYRYQLQNNRFPDTICQLVSEYNLELPDETVGQVHYVNHGDHVELGIYGGPNAPTAKRISEKFYIYKFYKGGSSPIKHEWDLNDYLYMADLEPFDWEEFINTYPFDMEDMITSRVEKRAKVLTAK